MSIEDPTLKIRVQVPAMLGQDCHEVAKRIVGETGTVLDSKWGREPTKWRETGGGWGRPRLEGESRGYVNACRAMAAEGSTEARLVAIIDSLTVGKP